MTLADALGILNLAASVATIGDVGVKLAAWLKSDKSASQVNSEVQVVLSKLPADATVDDIVRVLAPLYRAAGQVTLKAGDDNGGDLIGHGLDIKAGPGASVVISGGNGGANGKGGTVTLSSSRISGGDAL